MAFYFPRRSIMGGRVRRRTAAGTVCVGGRDESGRGSLGKWTAE